VKKKYKFSRIFYLIKPFWARIFTASFIILLVSVINQIFPLITRSLTDLVTQDKTKFLFFENPTLPSLIILLISIRFIVTILSRISQYLANILRNQLLHHLREIAFKHLLTLSVYFYNKNQSGKIMSKINRGTRNITSIVSSVGTQFLPDLVTATISLIILCRINWQIGIATTLIFPPFFYLRLKRYQALEKIEKKDQKIWDKEYGHFWEVLANIRLVKVFNAEKFEIKKFYKTTQKLIGNRIKMEKTYNRGLTADLLVELWMYLIYGYVFYLGVTGIFTIGTVILMVQYLQMVRRPFWSLGWVFWQIKYAQIGVRDYLKILDEKPDIKNPSFENTQKNHPPILNSKKSSPALIEFKDVCFKYPEESGQKVFSGLNFSIPPGKTLAIIGHSGAGKTTIANLLARFFDPDRGEILIDNINIKKVSLKNLYQNVGLVSQEDYFFDDTIANNLRYAKPNATYKEMKKACQTANALEFIDKLPKELDTIVGERGIRLSGGQKQRLSIARVILKDPRILILDEATSSLDSYSEKLVQEALWKLISNRTTLIIAHRLSTIKKADKIIVIGKQKIIEEGTHSQLIKKSGVYASFYQLQTGQLSKLKDWEILNT